MPTCVIIEVGKYDLEVMMNRWKNVNGRILVELMYGDTVSWTDTQGSVTTTKLARKINIRPVRLVEYLHELKQLGYLQSLHINYRNITFTLKRPNWADKPQRRWDRTSVRP